MKDPTSTLPADAGTDEREAMAKLIEELRPYAAKTLGSIRIDVREVAKIVAHWDALTPSKPAGTEDVEAVAAWRKYPQDWHTEIAKLHKCSHYVAHIKPIAGGSVILWAVDEINALRGELTKAREALEWYANSEIYKPHPHGPAFDKRDLSFRAIAALNPQPAQATEGVERLVTITVSIDRAGNVFEDTQCHGNSWADVYRGKRAVLERVKFLVEEHRQCPHHPLGPAEPRPPVAPDGLVERTKLHFGAMYSHRGDGIPTQYRFDNETRGLSAKLVTTIKTQASEIQAQAARLAELEGGIERGASDCQLAIDALGNSGPEFDSVKAGFGIIRNRLRAILHQISTPTADAGDA